MLASLDPQQSFAECGHIVLVNLRGCAVRFSQPAKIGTPVKLENLPANRPITGRIVTCISFGQHEKIWLLGVSLDVPGNVWGIESPPADWKL